MIRRDFIKSASLLAGGILSTSLIGESQVFPSWIAAEVPGGDRERLAKVSEQVDRIIRM